jgi:hypothetical protein
MERLIGMSGGNPDKMTVAPSGEFMRLQSWYVVRR